jgi:hypothetical protein
MDNEALRTPQKFAQAVSKHRGDKDSVYRMLS